MNLFPKHIYFNGQKKDVNSLLEQTVFETEWERDFFDFLKEWYSPEQTIFVNTSGSTGKPKTIKLHKDFVAASAKRTINFFELKTRDKVLHCLPSKFIAGKLMLVRALIGELDLHLVDPADDFRFLETEVFNFAAMVPTQVNKLLDLKKWGLEKLLIGGDAISSHLEKALKSKITACYSSYGMTETATHIALRPLNGTDAGSYYQCLDDIRVELSNNSCLQIYIPGLKELPLKTTDIAELKSDKSFKILGRSDNVIISGGIKYSPESIEKKLEKYIPHPFIISSLPDDKLGKQIVLKVQCESNRVLLSEIEKAAVSELTVYERPRKILFVDDLPKTKSGKIIRN